MVRKAHKASRDVVEEILPGQQKDFIAKMVDAGVTITYPDKQEFIDATAPVREKLGTGVWGEETYKKIVEIGQQDLG